MPERWRPTESTAQPSRVPGGGHARYTEGPHGEGASVFGSWASSGGCFPSGEAWGLTPTCQGLRECDYCRAAYKTRHKHVSQTPPAHTAGCSCVTRRTLASGKRSAVTSQVNCLLTNSKCTKMSPEPHSQGLDSNML